MSANGLSPLLRETLAELPNAQRQRLARIIEAALSALDAVVAVQLKPNADGLAHAAKWVAAADRLRASIVEFEEIGASRWVPLALNAVLDLGHDHRSGAFLLGGPAAVAAGHWGELVAQTSRQARTDLETLRRALAPVTPRPRRSRRPRKAREEMTDKQRQAAAAMVHNDFNQTAAARELGITRRALQKRFKGAERVLGKDLCKSLKAQRQRLPETELPDPDGPPPPKGRVHRANQDD